MSRKIIKSIVADIQIALVILFAALSGLLIGVFRGEQGFLDWLKALPYYSLWHLAWANIAVLLVMIGLAIWQKFTPKDEQAAPVTQEDLDAATRKMLEAFYDAARKEGRIPEQEWKDKDEEITRLTEELRKLQQQLAARSGEPAEAQLSRLLDAGDLDAAYRIKSQRAENFPRDLYELGVLCELRFDWPAALEYFRKAWQLGHDPEHGFKYAVFAQKLNHFNEAIAIYEKLLPIFTDPSKRAGTLNNLGLLYCGNQHMKEAEQAYDKALTIFRGLAEANPDAYLNGVATTLLNLAGLYKVTQRLIKAEQACGEALKIYRKLADANPDAYLPDVATTLNNLAILYSDTQRMNEAEQAYDEALRIYRKFADANPDAYLPDVATTLNNLGLLYRANQRMKEAEQAYDEALRIRRKLAEANPDAYLPYVAGTLNNLAVLYRATQHMKDAEQAYGEALKIYRNLAGANSDAYLPYVAMTLNNLANLYISMERITEAETHAAEAEGIREPLWQANPELHGNDVARIFGTRALICEASQKPAEALAYARRAFAAAYDPALKQQIQQLIDRPTPASQA